MNFINEGLVASFVLLIIVLVEILVVLFTTRAGKYLPNIHRIAGLEAIDDYTKCMHTLLGIPSIVNAFLNIDVAAIGVSE